MEDCCPQGRGSLRHRLVVHVHDHVDILEIEGGVAVLDRRDDSAGYPAIVRASAVSKVGVGGEQRDEDRDFSGRTGGHQPGQLVTMEFASPLSVHERKGRDGDHIHSSARRFDRLLSPQGVGLPHALERHLPSVDRVEEFVEFMDFNVDAGAVD